MGRKDRKKKKLTHTELSENERAADKVVKCCISKDMSHKHREH